MYTETILTYIYFTVNEFLLRRLCVNISVQNTKLIKKNLFNVFKTQFVSIETKNYPRKKDTGEQKNSCYPRKIDIDVGWETKLRYIGNVNKPNTILRDISQN